MTDVVRDIIRWVFHHYIQAMIVLFDLSVRIQYRYFIIQLLLENQDW